MSSTRVRGELGPACTKCGTLMVWTGKTSRASFRCRPCGAERNRKFKASRSPEQLEADKARANELRNQRRAAWTPEQRQAEYDRIREWRVRERDAYLGGARRWYVENAAHVLANKATKYRSDPASFIARNMIRKQRLRDAVCEHGPRCVDAAFLAAVYAEPCFYCGSATEDADHFYPISGGGLHCRENIVAACGPCNGSKFNHDPIEWMRSRAG